jgi:hypothetical protein
LGFVDFGVLLSQFSISFFGVNIRNVILTPKKEIENWLKRTPKSTKPKSADSFLRSHGGSMSVQLNALPSTNFKEEMEDLSLHATIQEAKNLKLRVDQVVKQCDLIYNASVFNHTVPLSKKRIEGLSQSLLARKADCIDLERDNQALIHRFGKYDEKHCVTYHVIPKHLSSHYHYSYDLNVPLSPKAHQAAEFEDVMENIQLNLRKIRGNIAVLEQQIPSPLMSRYCTIL